MAKEGVKERFCAVCGGPFTPPKATTVVCSPKCYSKWRYLSGKLNSHVHYRSISGNWDRYFRRLVGMNNRAATLSIDDLKNVLAKQNGLCALTGQRLTCKLVRGERQWTNASIDRIESGKGYTLENVQLVCAAVNNFRAGLSVQEFVRWCNLVTKHHERKKDG